MSPSSGPDPWFVLFFHRRLGNYLVHLTFTDCLSYLSLPFGREMIYGLLSSTGRHQTSANTVPALYKCRISDVVGGSTFHTPPVSIGCEDYVRLRFVDDLSSLAHKVQCRPFSFTEKTPPTRQDQQRNRYT